MGDWVGKGSMYALSACVACAEVGVHTVVVRVHVGAFSVCTCSACRLRSRVTC